ncbi:MAG TPA: septal ring lytic transglycosylase RlpA family protein [Solirubrobacterales bacterium]|nr:septal ring lytic transglycosylase RlpA family protein [Solirubrobacterales bacterium]
MVTAGIAGASASVPTLAETGPEASAAGSPPTAISLNGHRNVMAHRAVTLRGRVSPGGSRHVVIRIGGRKLRTHTRADGSYKARWRAPSSGVYRVRAKVVGSTVRSHRILVNVYRPAEASYYGPGLYGGGLACGGTLTPSKLGVANKTLPCGARVTLRYHRHTVTVPVIDRGPYAGNREYDLTAATKAKLGFPSTGTVLTTR